MAAPKPPTRSSVRKILDRLETLYPDASTELSYEGPFQLLAAVILSAQCTDDRVNQTTPALFAAYPDPYRMAQAGLPHLERLIHSCGFYRSKALALKQMAQSLVDNYGGEVPKTLDALVSLRGVGRKTASVVLNQAFDEPAIAVDTHVARVSRRLGWVRHKDPVKIEFELRALLEPEHWASLNGRLILHGRRLCKARKPLCESCPIAPDCPRIGVLQ